MQPAALTSEDQRTGGVDKTNQEPLKKARPRPHKCRRPWLPAARGRLPPNNRSSQFSPALPPNHDLPIGHHHPRVKRAPTEPKSPLARFHLGLVSWACQPPGKKKRVRRRHGKAQDQPANEGKNVTKAVRPHGDFVPGSRGPSCSSFVKSRRRTSPRWAKMRSMSGRTNQRWTSQSAGTA